MNISILPAGVSESEIICSLGAKTFSETFADMNNAEDMQLYLEQTFTISKTVSEIKEKGSVFYLAYVDGQIAGYAKLRSSEPPKNLKADRPIEIERIYALKEFIGKGVGKALMKKCIETAEEKEASVLWLGVWEHNPRAIMFYKTWGFEEFGEHDFRLGNDVQRDLLMKLYINKRV